LLPLLGGIDAVLASADDYSRAILASVEAAQLKIVSRWGVGYDSIDVGAATELGIVIAYTPGLLNDAVADYTFALLLGLARRIAVVDATVRQGLWTPAWGSDIAGKTLGVVGCGRIGQAVARRATGFNMRVLGCDVAPSAQAEQSGIRFVTLEELLAESDFVSLHAALTPQTRGLIGEAQLRRMKRTGYLINAARGAMVDETALVRALHEGWIAGAALDTFACEPLSPTHPLRNAPNLLLSPHQASFGRETGQRVSVCAAQAIVDLMAHRRPLHVVNPAVFESVSLRAWRVPTIL
jgi:phosphoglycerate dehydrogenase-like enzyme